MVVDVAKEQGDEASVPRSILAVLAGLAIVVALSVGTDAVLEATVLPQMVSADPPDTQLFIALCYRTAITVFAGFVTARLAPAKSMLHGVILGIVGTLLGALGAVAMWNIGHHWYPILLAVLALPSCWLGAKLAPVR